MPIPVFEGSAVSSDGSSVSSLVVAKAAGVVAGELLVMFVINERADVTTDTYNVPTGWTKIGAGLIPTSSSMDCSGMAYWREASGDTGDDAPTVTWTGGARCVGWYIRISGADVVDPINVVGAITQSFSGSPVNIITITSATTDAADCLAFYYVSFDGNDGNPFSVDAAWTERGDDAASSRSGGCWGTQDMASAAATGTAVVTSSANDGQIGRIFAINGAAGGGGGGNPWYYYAQQ